MRIGLIQYQKLGVSEEHEQEVFKVPDAAKTQSEKLDKGVNGTLQELILPGATIVLRKLSFDKCLKTYHKNVAFCYGLHFVLEGNFEFTCLESKSKVAIPSGSYNLIQWSGIDGSQKLKGEKCNSVDIYFTREFLGDIVGMVNKPILGHFFRASGVFPRSLWDTEQPIAPKLRESLLDILHCQYEDSARKNYIESKIKLLVIDLFLGKENGNSKAGQLPSSDYMAIDKVDLYIKRNLRKKLTIKELSEVAGFNTTKLKGCFKKIHQTTIFKYITRLRMEKAKTLVLEENLSISQAAYEVGYSNPQHFTVAFKKTMGYLPSALLGTPK
ncbi:AraC family transcriptional regulator [Arenibacter sp. F20364]|uniref:helix-turn-helix domain-containing protein n=1 Tax=Arenibacter sp. F20364 TaxID=2926415 RepID=UPI001FF37F1D|nr:AraC family transcriptional regulator [Arenibacter sp. F20364]MCK0192706.1 AraC family transcriptional regulator [Arenibacter sp. F20364]